MKIVGVGCGPGLLTRQALEVISNAHLIVGSERAIDIIRTYIPDTCTVREITDYKALRTLPDDTVVLSTGDPMVSGLGYLDGEVIPGISSIQYAAAQLHIPLTKTVIITAHGRSHQSAIQEVLEELRRGRIVCIITDPSFIITDLARSLLNDLPDIRIILCEELGYPSQRIVFGDTANPPVPLSGMNVLFLARPDQVPKH